MDDEWRALHPAVRTVWSLRAAVIGVVVWAVPTALIVMSPSNPVWALATVPIIAFFVWLSTDGVRRRYDRWGFRFAPNALELRHGVWFRTVAAVPYHRIQQIDIDQGPIERRFGMVTLTLTTASTASDGKVPGIRSDEAEGIRSRLVESAERDDGV